jgi:GT2 family glycosyltransferase
MTTAPRRDDGPSVSVIIPVRDGEATLRACIEALASSSIRDFEVVFVDDGSRDATPGFLLEGAERLAKIGVEVTRLRNETSRGAFAARNQGAALARGAVLFFTDADVQVQEETIARVWQRCGTEALPAVIGLYTLDQPHDDLVTRYKNSWIRYSYLVAGDHVDWFFTAVGAVRRDVWETCGPFREHFERDTGGGDVDYGRRLRACGFTIRLDKSLEVRHRRAFTAAALLRNDFLRAYGWAGLGLATAGLHGSMRGGIANVDPGFVVSVALAGALLAAPGLAFALGGGWTVVATLALAYVASVGAFLWWAARVMSPSVALRFLPISFIDHVACGFGVATALARHMFAGIGSGKA